MKNKATTPVTEKEYRDACKKHAKALAEVDKLKAEKKDEQTKMEQRYAKPMEKQNAILMETLPILQQYSEYNREELFTTAKSIDTGYGLTIGFRMNPKKLAYGEGVKEEDLLAVLKRKGLVQYIKTKESVDAQAIIKADEDKKLGSALQSVACGVEQKEEFFAKPA